jgi:gas vesicle protein
MSDRETDFTAYLAGFIIGGVVGAVAALLLAPQSGEETRTMIRDKSIELKDKAASSAEQAYEKASATVDDLRKRIDDLAAQMRKEEGEMAAGEPPAPPPAS